MDFVTINVPEIVLKPGDTFCLNVTVIDNNSLEGRRFFLIVLLDLRWGEIISTTAMTINDDDGKSYSGCMQGEKVESRGVCFVNRETVLIGIAGPKNRGLK